MIVLLERSKRSSTKERRKAMPTTVYLYRIERPRAWSIDETGTFITMALEPYKDLVYNDWYTDEYRTLLHTFQVHKAESRYVDCPWVEEFQILSSDPLNLGHIMHYPNEWSDQTHYHFSTQECAQILGCPEREVIRLIDEKKLPAKKRGDFFFVTGPAIIDVAQTMKVPS
jgi:hypothetical protein